MKELIWLQLVFLSRPVSFLTQSIFCSFLVSWWLSWFISSMLTDPDLFVSEAQITGNETVTCVCFVWIDKGILSCCRTQSLNTTLMWFCRGSFISLGSVVSTQRWTEHSAADQQIQDLPETLPPVWADLLQHLHRLTVNLSDTQLNYSEHTSRVKRRVHALKPSIC